MDNFNTPQIYPQQYLIRENFNKYAILPTLGEEIVMIKIALLTTALLVSGCNSDVRTLLGKSVGSTISASDTKLYLENREQYFGYICQAAGLETTKSSFQSVEKTCDFARMDSNRYKEFVLEGMADIDRRCNSYLAWIFYVKEGKTNLSKILSDSSAFATKILTLTGVEGKSFSLISESLGFAQTLFDDYVSIKLLTSLDASSVKSIVSVQQKVIRDDLDGATIRSKGKSIRYLRRYLETCIPYRIANDINTSLTVSEIATDDQGKPMSAKATIKMAAQEKAGT